MAIYEAAEFHFRELPCIFHHIIRTDAFVYGINWHDEVELVHCIAGEGTAYLDGDSVHIRAGETVLFNHKVMHEIFADNRCEYFCVIFSKNFMQENGIDVMQVRFQNHIAHNRVIADAVEELWDKEYRDSYDSENFVFYTPDPFRMVRIRKHLTDILMTLCENYIETTHVQKAKGDVGLLRVKKAIEYMNNHFSENITLMTLASMLSINKYQLTREFKKYTNMSVVRYHNTIRCRAAKYMLLEGKTVADAAYATGFNNLSYFTKVYAECIAELPSETRNRVKQR